MEIIYDIRKRNINQSTTKLTWQFEEFIGGFNTQKVFEKFKNLRQLIKRSVWNHITEAFMPE